MKRCPDQGGFSLVELMVAIGILAVGAAMVASAFPVAMLENKESVEYTTAAMVSENALAICRNKLRHSYLNGNVAVAEDTYAAVGYIALAEGAYPMPRWLLESEYPSTAVYEQDWVKVDGTNYPSARYGWMVGARQLEVGVNDYELSIVVYQKFLPTDRPGKEIQLDPSCMKVNYAPDGITVDPNSRKPTIGHWVVRTSLRQ